MSGLPYVHSSATFLRSSRLAVGRRHSALGSNAQSLPTAWRRDNVIAAVKPEMAMRLRFSVTEFPVTASGPNGSRSRTTTSTTLSVHWRFRRHPECIASDAGNGGSERSVVHTQADALFAAIARVFALLSVGFMNGLSKCKGMPTGPASINSTLANAVALLAS